MNRNKLQLLGAMGIFGTIGIFVRYIPLPSATVAFVRGVLGVLCLLLTMLVTKKKADLAAIRKNLLLLLISGGAIGINWILLFEAYRYTTVATATVCYYLAPVFLLLASPLLGERMNGKKLICLTVAMAGMICVSGLPEGTLPDLGQLQGIALGIGAALLYATVMLLNKKLSPIPAYDKTIVQLGASALIILPYILFSQGFALSGLTGTQWVLLVIVGVIHTGIAYALYFGSMEELPAHTIAIFSYLDPVIAVFLSALLLREPLGIWGILGAVLILGSALYSELLDKRKPPA